MANLKQSSNFYLTIFFLMCSAMFTSALLCIAGSTNAQIQYENNIDNDNSRFCLSIGPSRPTAVRFEIQVATDTPGWVGVGFGPFRSFSGSDFVIATQNPNNSSNVILKDCHDFQNGEPVPDLKPESDWSVYYYNYETNENNNFTRITVYFRREFKTTDPNVGHDLEITDELMHPIWAYGESNDFNPHKFYYGRTKLNLKFPQPAPTITTTSPSGASDKTVLFAFVIGIIMVIIAKLF